MAGIRKIYTSDNEYLEDIAKNTRYFDASQYEKQKESGTGLEYLNLIASGVDNLPSTFDNGLYDRLSSDDRLNYFAFKTTMKDDGSEEYEKNETYFNNLAEQLKNQDVYNGLSDVEKVLHTGVGFLGNLGTQVLGIAEGLLDFGSMVLQGVYSLAGNKEMADYYKENVAKDTTAYTAAQNAMNEYINKYTFIDKNILLKGINDVATGIVRMAPMLIPGAGPVGSFAYYASMAGNTAQEALAADPDISNTNLWLYTAGSVGLEAGVEFLSGKIFDGDTIAKLAFGGKGVGTGKLVADLGLNFVSEGIEEGVSEIFGSLLYNQLVDPNAELATIEDVLYAAIIGGVTGAVMTGGQALGTTRYSVTKDGRLVRTADLTSSQKKTTKQLGLSKSYAMNALLQEIQQGKDRVDEVTKLKAKYGESLDSIVAKHGSEYQKALAKDTETKQKQANAILDLANLMNTIGVEQFARSTKYLEANLNEAQERIDNYFNHTDVLNKVASAIFKINNPGKSFTPTVATNDEQTLIKVMREAFPGLHVTFGKMGSEDGTAVRYIKSNGGDYLFIESGMINTMGYENLLKHAVNYAIKDGLVQQLDKLNIELGGIIEKVFGEKRFRALSLEEKQEFAERILFDSIYNKRFFWSDKKAHSQIYNYLVQETEKIQKFGRKTESNKVRLHSLLEARQKCLNSLAETLGNGYDYLMAQSMYKLSDDELKASVIDKSETTILNNKQRLMDLKIAEQAISRIEAIDDLLNNRVETDKTVDFDWSKLYDETYYKKDWVAELKQKARTNDFGEALREYIATAHGTELSLSIRQNIYDLVIHRMSNEELKKTAESFFTEEYLNSITDQTELQVAVVNALFNSYQLNNKSTDTEADSVVIDDNTVQGTGKIKFFKGDIYDRTNILDREQRRSSSKSAERKPERVVSGSRTYKRTEISGVSIELQDDTTYDDFQRELAILTREEYGLNVHFFKGNVTDIDEDVTTSDINGFIIDKNIYIKDDGTRTPEQILHALRHEITHDLIKQYPAAYQKAKKAFETRLRDGNYVKVMYKLYSRPNMYGNSKNYNEADILEEVIVNLLLERNLYNSDEQALVDEISQEFYKEVIDYRNEELRWFWDTDKDVSFPKDTKKTNIKKSIFHKDSNGKTLTPQQAKYFEKSVVRNSQGKLLAMYHGTASGGFTTFDLAYAKYGAYGLGFYFTDNYEVAEGYSKTKKGDGERQVYAVYLNITNPIDMDAPADVALWKKSVPDEVDLPVTGNNVDFFRALEDYYVDMELPRDEAAESIMYDLMNMGYDGITHIGGRLRHSSTIEHRVYIAFDSNQIKSVTNTKPTEAFDINFDKSFEDFGFTIDDLLKMIDEELHSEFYDIEPEKTTSKLTKEELRAKYVRRLYEEGKLDKLVNKLVEIKPEMKKYFADSKMNFKYDPLNINEKTGLVVMHHGTPYDFTEFSPRRIGESGSYMGPGYYFTHSLEYADEYAQKRGTDGRVLTVLLNIKKPMSRNKVTVSKEKLREFMSTLINPTESSERYKYPLRYDNARELDAAINNLLSEHDNDVDLFTALYDNSLLLFEEFYGQLTDILGYDGVIAWNKAEGTQAVTFKSNQSKIIFNTKPTESPDIRFSKEIKQPNITDTDIKQLASTNYKTGEIRKSKTKGFEDVDYEAASVLDYEAKNYETLLRIKTLKDLKTVLDAIGDNKISGLEATFLLDLIQGLVIPFNFKGKQSAIDMLEPYLAARTTQTAQELAARSELFAESHAVENFVNDLSNKTGLPVQISNDIVVKYVPYYANRTDYLKKIENEYMEIIALRKKETDPYMKQQYTLQLKELRDLARMVSDGNTAAVLDYTIRKLQDEDTNKAENNEKIMEITRDIIADLIQHVDVSGTTAQYDPNKKYTLSPEHAAKVASAWEKINSFRYLAMLSSPITGGRNAITNTMISMNAIVEDAAAKNIEKTHLLRADSQANYTGDYDEEFSKFIEEEYATRINKDTKGDKYHEKELTALQQEWAQENDPLKKHEYLYKIKQFEQKMLNDQPWTKRRVMRNLKNTMAGSMNVISNSVYSEIKALYHGNSAQEILDNMRKTNSPLTSLFEQVYIKNQGNDMIGTIKLASKLGLSKNILEEIYNNALYRGNKLLFKTDNALNKIVNNLKKNHPMAAAFVSLFIPFARTSYNTTMYIINHSPVGIAKGIVQGLQTRNMYINEMRNEIENYFKHQYITQHKAADKAFKFDKKKFNEWMSANLSAEQLSAVNGDYKAIKTVFDIMAVEGKVNTSSIGSSNMFARATTIESLTQGLNGTAWLTLGLILATMVKGFKIDDDDYMGPVLTIGDIKWKLSDLSPFATMFSVGAVINSSDSVLDSFNDFFKIIIDESMLNVVESALQYSDSIPDYLGNQSINIVQQYIPAVFKNITKLFDNSKKDKSGNYFEKLVKTTLSNTPFASWLVANKIDPYTGDTLKIYRSGLLEALLNQISPISFRTEVMSDMERLAKELDVETTGLTGRFTVNDKDYSITNKEKYAKFKANYIDSQYKLIMSGKQKVTVEDDNGNRITTTYNKLNNKQKKNVISRLYIEASNLTKIKWWIDSGNSYVVTSRELYDEYRALYNSNKIIYNKTWSKSKFVEK